MEKTSGALLEVLTSKRFKIGETLYKLANLEDARSVLIDKNLPDLAGEYGVVSLESLIPIQSQRLVTKSELDERYGVGQWGLKELKTKITIEHGIPHESKSQRIKELDEKYGPTDWDLVELAPESSTSGLYYVFINKILQESRKSSKIR